AVLSLATNLSYARCVAAPERARRGSKAHLNSGLGVPFGTAVRAFAGSTPEIRQFVVGGEARVLVPIPVDAAGPARGVPNGTARIAESLLEDDGVHGEDVVPSRELDRTRPARKVEGPGRHDRLEGRFLAGEKV